MNATTAISVENISKVYKLGMMMSADRHLRTVIANGVRSLLPGVRRRESSDSGREEFWALRDINFEVQQGEILGVIGKNGAGKSTLLKILSRITHPTEGRAEIVGRVGSLLEVGTGFHPELSGRENVFLNGAILGMTRREIRARFDEIVEFAEISKFIDTPVKRYSSGMYVRLAFAIAAHLQPEVMIVDEVLAVGDASFQRKCLNKMQGVARQGRTVLFVSHNMGSVRALCERGIVLQNGRTVFDGSCEDAIGTYLGALAESAENAFSADNPDRSGDGRVRVVGGRILQKGNAGGHVIAGDDVALEFDYENPGNVTRADMGLTIYNQYGLAIGNISTELTNYELGLKNEGTIKCELPRLPLMPGEYRVAISVRADRASCDHIPNALVFTVDSSVFFETGRVPPSQYSAFLLSHQWRHE